MKLEITPNTIPTKELTKTTFQKFITNILNRSSSGNTEEIRGPNNQKVKEKNEIPRMAAAIPEIAPCTKNGPRMNQLEAPTKR